MFKIYLSVRNRLGITKKCIEAIERHSVFPYQLYIYDNLTSYRLRDHFKYYSELFEQHRAAQITFTSRESTFNVFSKVASCNFFGQQHEQDPYKDFYDFIVLLDNDVIVLPEWDKTLKEAWKDIDKYSLDKVKIITVANNGLKNPRLLQDKIAGRDAIVGRFSGSAIWCVRNDFFSDIGFLDLSVFDGINKKHDQMYWRKLRDKTDSIEYILGINNLAFLYDKIGSVCNALTKNKDCTDKDIEFSDDDERIENMSFEEFYTSMGS